MHRTKKHGLVRASLNTSQSTFFDVRARPQSSPALPTALAKNSHFSSLRPTTTSFWLVGRRSVLMRWQTKSVRSIVPVLRRVHERLKLQRKALRTYNSHCRHRFRIRIRAGFRENSTIHQRPGRCHSRSMKSYCLCALVLTFSSSE